MKEKFNSKLYGSILFGQRFRRFEFYAVELLKHLFKAYVPFNYTINSLINGQQGEIYLFI